MILILSNKKNILFGDLRGHQIMPADIVFRPTLLDVWAEGTGGVQTSGENTTGYRAETGAMCLS